MFICNCVNVSVQDVCVDLSESMTEELKCAMLIQQSHEGLDSLQGRIEGSSNDSNALKVKDAAKNQSLTIIHAQM